MPSLAKIWLEISYFNDQKPDNITELLIFVAT